MAVLILAETDEQRGAVAAAGIFHQRWRFTDEDLAGLAKNPILPVYLSALPLKYPAERWADGERLLRRMLVHCISEPTDLALSPFAWSTYVSVGRADQAALALLESGKHELALPLYEALHSIGQGLQANLGHLPAELRRSTEDVMKVLLRDLDELRGPRPAQPPPGARTRRRRK
jgi:hypothetical protein